jgi:hypothetical protein
VGWLDDARFAARAVSSFMLPYVSYLRSAEHRELYLSGLHPRDRSDDMTATRRLAAILPRVSPSSERVPIAAWMTA